MYLLTTFKQQQTKSKELTTKQLRNRALLSGALVVPGLAVASNDIYKGANLEKNLSNNLSKNKAELIANHPDKFIGKDESVIKAATDKFKQLSSEKDKLKNIQDKAQDLKKLKGFQKLKRAIGINTEIKAKNTLDNIAEKQSQKLGRKVVINPIDAEAFIKGSKLGKKIGYGLTGLGAIGAGVAAAKYINHKRKEREDKGKVRGKYNK